MIISKTKLKNIVFESVLSGIMEKILYEDAERRKDWNLKWSAIDLHDKVRRLNNHILKLKKMADQSPGRRSSVEYLKIAEQLQELVDRIIHAYNATKDPNVIWKVYEEMGLDPSKL